MILVDAGPLVALIDRGESEHAACVAVLKTLHPPMVTTWPAFTEAMYLAGDAGGWKAQQALWRWVEEGTLVLRHLSPKGEVRTRVLMEKYADLPMDLADASLVALAEELNVSQVFTLDRDFRVYRRHGKKAFRVIP